MSYFLLGFWCTIGKCVQAKGVYREKVLAWAAILFGLSAVLDFKPNVALLWGFVFHSIQSFDWLIIAILQSFDKSWVINLLAIKFMLPWQSNTGSPKHWLWFIDSVRWAVIFSAIYLLTTLCSFTGVVDVWKAIRIRPAFQNKHTIRVGGMLS